MRRLLRTALLAAGVLAALIAAALVVGLPLSSPPPTGSDLRDLEFQDVRSGQKFRLRDFAGRVVLLDFLTTWCPTCRPQLFELVDAKPALGDQVVFVSLAVDLTESAEDVRRFAAETGATWRFAFDTHRLFVGRFSAEVSVRTLPTLVIIDVHGGLHNIGAGVKNAQTIVDLVRQYGR